MLKVILVISVCLFSIVSGAYAADVYTCPKLVANGHKQQASAIDLYSGHPSEMAMLKPDNADTEDKSALYWSMGSSQYDYWYVCNYKNSKTKREFKLTKNYQSCSNIGLGKIKNKLQCN
jgi:hypothetical protein